MRCALKAWFQYVSILHHDAPDHDEMNDELEPLLNNQGLW